MRPFVQGPERKLIARANGLDEHDLDQPFAVASCAYHRRPFQLKYRRRPLKCRPDNCRIAYIEADSPKRSHQMRSAACPWFFHANWSCRGMKGYDMSQSLKVRHNFLSAVAATTAGKRAVATGSLLVAGRVTARLVAAASVFLASHMTSALADPAAQVEASKCTVCHGMHGEGGPGGVPRLAGQNADYMNHALSMFKTQTRASAIMQPIARNLSDLQIRQLADHFANQSAPRVDTAASASPQLVLAGKQLADKGAANVGACFSCHAAQGKGNGARFPGIAAEPAQFVINRLHEFQARAQGKTPEPGTMTAVAAALDEKQIEEAAAYLSQLGP
jgi:cytochrome c553